MMNAVFSSWGSARLSRALLAAGVVCAVMGTTPARAVIARTDPHEQESVVLLPELEHLVP